MTLLFLSLSLFWFQGSTAYNMPVSIGNLQAAKGQLMVAIYKSGDGFLAEDKAIFKKNYAIKEKGTFALEIPNLAEGNYAISCYHDVNGNGTLDKNLFGVPTEPYGFSQNARPKFRAPNWDEAKFYFKGQKIELRVDTW
jgi:uncharacterized protein (DUF2141 family)